jgi:3-hydroxybutyryl-CoA dehydrogenase
MGAGIAQVAARAGFDVLLYDIGRAPLEAGLVRIRFGLDRLVQRGKLSPDDREGLLAHITTTSSLADFQGADFVVEAAPEVLELKKEIFQALDRTCRSDVVLATNTSSLSVTEIGALTDRHDRVVGMHFFNPVPAMRLVEVVRGARTSPETAALTAELTRLLGKEPVQARDTPGFIVNRIARPFPGEALRILGEGVAGVAQIDRAAKLGAGFPMGPFELMDLVGMDINFAVNRSVFEQFFYEPRFRPHPLQAQMVKANLLGRKTGAGWYRYEGEQVLSGPAGAEFSGDRGPHPESIRTVSVIGDEAVAELVWEAGYTPAPDPADADVVLVGDFATTPFDCRDGALVLLEASRATVTSMAAGFHRPERVVGYGGIPSLTGRKLVEVATGLSTDAGAAALAAGFFRSLGRDVEVIRDGPGLIVPRLIACLVNEAAYALMEGVALVGDINTAMRLGVNYPQGPLEWADSLGPRTVLQVLEGLYETTRDDRYRPCPLLVKVAQSRRSFSSLA